MFTTVNVQRLDSLNGVVGGITGVRIGETMPDTVFDGADQVILVDFTADELLARLRLDASPGASLPGDPSTRLFSCKAAIAGSYVIHFKLKRPWEPDAVDTHSVTIHARGK